MSVVSVEARSFILALFIRDDGERFLLGDNGYDFIDSQLHFTANAIENDEVQKQGTDGVLVAGQVRRASVQTFDGYIGDATTSKAKIEQMRRDFFAFFAKGHHFRVIYVDCNRDAWQRKGGYLVDAPEVKELWQIHPEYHVGLNFEDVNYYEYDENAEGEEILANVLSVPIPSEIEGGLEWDEDGAISVLPYGDSKTASGNPISISDAVEAPLSDFKLKGDTAQTGTPTPSAPVPVQTVTGENVVRITGKNLYPFSDVEWDNPVTTAQWCFQNGSSTAGGGAYGANITDRTPYKVTLPAGTYKATAYNISSNIINIQAYKNGTSSEIIVTNPVNINSSNPTSTITLTEQTTLCFRYRVTNPSLGIGDTKIQLEKGSATDYEPYQSQSYPISLGSIELCKIGDYQDYIWKDGEDWKVHKETAHATYDWAVIGIAANNTSGETVASANGAFQMFFGSTFASSERPNIRLSENLGKYNSTDTISGNAEAQAMQDGTFKPRDMSGTVDRIYFRNTAYIGKTGNEMKAIMLEKSGGSNFWWGLSTPTDTEITNEALVGQLEAVLSQGYTYAGTNNITTITPNEQGELEVEYYSGYQDGGYVWEEGGSGGPTTVANESISAVYPVWTVYGPAQNPILENTTNNTSIEYVGMVADGQTLVIDMGAQTASLDGLNVLPALTGDFIQLEAGSNILLYSASNDAPASEIGWSEIVG